MSVESGYEVEKMATGFPVSSPPSLAQPWESEEITAEQVREAIGKRIAGWTDLGSAGPGRLVLALPWHLLATELAKGRRPAHVVAAELIAREFVHRVHVTRGMRRSVMLLDYTELSQVRSGNLGLAAAIALRQLVHDPAVTPVSPPVGWDGRMRMVERDLRSGRVVVVLQGVIDLDRPLPERDDGFSTAAEVEHLLEEIKAVGVQHVVLVGRGSGRADVVPVVAYWERLKEHSFQLDWLLAPPHPVNPLAECQRSALIDTNGPVFGQILPLRVELNRANPALEGQQRLALAAGYLAPRPPGVADLEGAITGPVRLGREVTQSTLGLAPGEARIDEAGVWSALAQPGGMVVLDGIGPRGGNGKTTLLGSLLLQAYLSGRPAVVVHLNELIDALSGNPLGEGETLLERTLAVVGGRIESRHLPNAAERVERAVLRESRPLLLLEGLNEIPPGRAVHFAQWVLGPVTQMLVDPQNETVVVVSRTTEWWGKDEAERRKEATGSEVDWRTVPAPAQLRHRLETREGTVVPLIVQTAELDVVAAQSVLARLPGGAQYAGVDQPLLAHPFSLGALLMLAREPVQTATTDQGAMLTQWEVVEVLVEQIVRWGLAGTEAARAKRPDDRLKLLGEVASQPHGGVLDTADQATVQRVVEVLDGVALAMAEQGTPKLRHDRMREAIAEELERQRHDAIELEVDQRAKELLAALGMTSTTPAFREQLRGQVKRDDVIPDPERILADLQAVSLVLVGNPDDGYAFSHDLLRDVLGSRELIDLRTVNRTRFESSVWLSHIGGNEGILGIGLARQFSRNLDLSSVEDFPNRWLFLALSIIPKAVFVQLMEDWLTTPDQHLPPILGQYKLHSQPKVIKLLKNIQRTHPNFTNSVPERKLKSLLENLLSASQEASRYETLPGRGRRPYLFPNQDFAYFHSRGYFLRNSKKVYGLRKNESRALLMTINIHAREMEHSSAVAGYLDDEGRWGDEYDLKADYHQRRLIEAGVKLVRLDPYRLLRWATLYRIDHGEATGIFNAVDTVAQIIAGYDTDLYLECVYRRLAYGSRAPGMAWDIYDDIVKRRPEVASAWFMKASDNPSCWNGLFPILTAIVAPLVPRQLLFKYLETVSTDRKRKAISN